MGIQDTYSKRLKRQQQAGQPDVFQYGELPKPFRAQVFHILRDAIGLWEEPSLYEGPSFATEMWDHIHAQMAREFGVRELPGRGLDPCERCLHLIDEAETLQVLDMIEYAFRIVDGPIREFIRRRSMRHHDAPRQAPDAAIKELNGRFMEYSLGYAFVAGQIIRKDSQFIHAEAVQPAFQLLADAQFSGPSEEFMSAHTHYRHGRHKEAIQDALKAFESTMKAICDAKNWEYDQNDAAAKLIEVLLDNKLIPSYLQNHFTAFQAVLKGGLPTLRNKRGGHGQGATPVEVPPYFAAYALHLAAANIVMLVEAHKAELARSD